MEECARCKSPVSENVLQCPNCGTVLSQPVTMSTSNKAIRRELHKKRAAETAAMKSTIYGGLALMIVAAFVFGTSAWMKSADPPKASPAKSLETVYNSAFDGSVRQVEQYLKRNLKDPDSLQAMEWSPVRKNGSGFVVSVRYRAKNSFGGYIVTAQEFHLDSAGGIVQVLDLN